MQGEKAMTTAAQTRTSFAPICALIIFVVILILPL
jgi:hypothetical protein